MTSFDTVYIAYQGDCTTHQSISIVDQDPFCPQCVIDYYLRKSLRACLIAWYETETRTLTCTPQGFVIRATKNGWTCYSVVFTDYRLETAEIEVVSNEEDGDMPTGWPTFLRLETDR
jgi:hypothetical protein